MNFKVGQKVICIDGDGWYCIPETGEASNVWPEKDKIYTITSIEVFRGDTYLGLKELPDTDQFCSYWFRPVDESFAESVLEMIKYANKTEYITFKGHGVSTKKQQREN